MLNTVHGSSARAPATQTLERLRATLSITNHELASLFGQTRQVVDGWFHGVAPDAIDSLRIEQLRDAVEALAGAGVPVSLATLRRKVKGGSSILSAISTDDNLDAVIERLIEILGRETSQRDRLRRQTAGRIRAGFDPGDYGAPAWVEEREATAPASAPPKGLVPVVFFEPDPWEARKARKARAAAETLSVVLVDVDNVGSAPNIAHVRNLILERDPRTRDLPVVVCIAGNTSGAKAVMTWWLQCVRLGLSPGDIQIRIVQPRLDAADDALVRMLEDVRAKSPLAALVVMALTSDRDLRRRIAEIAGATGRSSTGSLAPLGGIKR